ncbi:hypothetical protein ACHWQZ_G018373 [Mnemiopsis leidyi]
MVAPDAPKKCLKEGCQFYGSEQNNGFCSGCARKVKRESETALSPGSNSAVQSESALEESNLSGRVRSSTARKRKSTEIVTDDTNSQSTSNSAKSYGAGKAKLKVKRAKVNRCDVCSKKVGLLGFDCRCGGLFCALHRGDDEHGCTFDYKSLQRAELAQNNPRIVADKVKKL